MQKPANPTDPDPETGQPESTEPPFDRERLSRTLRASPVQSTLDSALDDDIELFRNSADEPYIRIASETGGREVWPVRSPRVRNWLAGLCWSGTREFLSAAQIESLLNVLEGLTWDYPRQEVADADAWKLAEGDPLVQVVLEFMATQTKWHGLVSRLLTHLASIAAANKLDGPKSRWPRVATVFGIRLRGAAPVLASLGIGMTMHRRTTGMHITLEKAASPDDLAAPDVESDADVDKSDLSTFASTSLNLQTNNDLQQNVDNVDKSAFGS